MLRQSFFPNFFSIEDILATQERIPCKFEKPIRRLGFLDPTSENEDVAVGATIELPYWLASSLTARRQHIVTADIPKIYKEAYREIMKADSCVVDLHKLGLHYFEFGLYLTKLDHRESPAIVSLLAETFRDRFRQVCDWSHNSGTDPSISQRLDSLEKQLFFAGRQSRALLDAWLNDGSGKIVAADMVVNHKKRKLTRVDV